MARRPAKSAGKKTSSPKVIRPTKDVAEAVERIVPRRQILIEVGDVCIGHAQAGLKSAAERHVYGLSRHGRGPIPGRFTSFEHAVAAGDELARNHRVRLFYQDAPGTAPQLLKDYRPQ